MQLIVAWLPVWVLFTVLMVAAHNASTHAAALYALRMIVAAAALSALVVRFVNRHPWPAHISAGFVVMHIGLALAFAFAWVLLNSAIDSLLRLQLVLSFGPGLVAYLFGGVWLYVLVAGVCYAANATRRAGLAETMAAQSQLAALRAQLNPHFLFNALHTVVQLIPRDPALATQAALRLSDLLRASLEEDRDLITLANEREFVMAYLDLERLRFDERLVITHDIEADADALLLPTFALLTLVENAVRHGAAPNINVTHVQIVARVESGTLRLTVSDDGVGAHAAADTAGGTGLRRLRDRLTALYGSAGSLVTRAGDSGGFAATLLVPQHDDD